MKLRLSLASLLLITLAACGGPQPATPASAPAVVPTTAPEVNPTSVPPTQLPPTAVPPTSTTSPASAPAPTVSRPAPPDTIVPKPTDTVTVKPRPTPTSAGPLSAAIYPANCRSDPAADKPGRVIVQISIEATGGNGRYRYFYQDKESPTKFIDVIGEKGTRLIGEVTVASGDGQEIKKEFDIAISQLTCP